LYQPDFEKDSCGFGLIAHIDGKPSHWLVQTAIQALERLTHRGAVAADGKTGDGCGLLMKKPEDFLRAVAAEHDIRLGRLWAVGCVFLNPDPALAGHARMVLQEELAADGLDVAGWRVVPTDHSACGDEALRSLPRVEHVLVNAPDQLDEAGFERRLFTARRRAEKRLDADEVFYVSSLSSRVLSYKGLVMPANLPVF